MSAKHNLVCEQGTTFVFQFTIKTGDTPWNLSDYSATMTIRPFIGSNETTLYLTNDNTKIVIDALNGRLTTTIPVETTTPLPAGRYVYDFVLNSGTVVTRILEGKFVVTPAVTA
jgi:outer membrane protein assembly factor BamB